MKQSSVSTPHGLASRVRRIALALALVLGTIGALGGCGRDHATSLLEPGGRTQVARTADGAANLDLDGPLHLDGEIGPGALWSIDVPAGWNGDLVVWLHGYTNPAAPITLPAFGPMRDAMLAEGYAVVASSYSENGYTVKLGMIQSHQLRGVFASRIGQPARTYLVGVSLGGIIGALLLERFPEQYDGGLLVSGVVGGSVKEMTYIGDIRVLFDAMYPGVLPGDLLHVPEGTDVLQELGQAQAAIVANPQGAGIIAALARVPPEYASGSELVQTILTALGFQLQGANDIFARTHGHSFFENADWRYTGPLPQPVLDQVNATVARYRATPDAANYLDRYGSPNGNLALPVIALHNSRDPVVPYRHESWYLAAVTDQAATPFLLQRTLLAPYGHAVIQPAELTANLADLAQWVETGTKPAP